MDCPAQCPFGAMQEPWLTNSQSSLPGWNPVLIMFCPVSTVSSIEVAITFAIGPCPVAIAPCPLADFFPSPVTEEVAKCRVMTVIECSSCAIGGRASTSPVRSLYSHAIAKCPDGISTGIVISITSSEYPPPLPIVISGEIGLKNSPSSCPSTAAYPTVNSRASA